jgi:hypothetical protein
MCLLSDTQNREVFTNNKKTYTAKVGLSVRSAASATAAVTLSLCHSVHRQHAEHQFSSRRSSSHD